MTARRRIILSMVALLSSGASLSFADIFGHYQNLEEQVNSAVAVVVFKLHVPPPAPAMDPLTNLYDAKIGTVSGVLNPYDIEILGSLKGPLEKGTTVTAQVGSFTWPTDIGKFDLPREAVPPIGRLQPNQVYLTFMESVDRNSCGALHATAANVELNLLHVIGKGHYRLQENEPLSRQLRV